MAVSVPELPLHDTVYAMTTRSAGCLLDDLGVVRFQGADTRQFLQGQLSNDMARLTPHTLLRAALNTPQGRTLALMGLVVSEGDVLAVMPRELIANVCSLLKRYVLRSKVQLADDSASFRIVGLTAADTMTASLPAGQSCRYGLLADQRLLWLQPAAQASGCHYDTSRDSWRALDIAAGIPYVSSVLSGEFVAQMLNLDCIDAISFTKGCYTGQEVIARAHYRGRVKRRMQRFVTPASSVLQAGSSGHLQDGRAFRVIDAVLTAEGQCQFLAVVPLAHQETEADGAIQTARLSAQSLPLPYPLPD